MSGISARGYTRQLMTIGAILAFFGVALGAFGAHGLEATLTANGRAATFDTASQYHLIHALAMFAVAFAHMHVASVWVQRAGWLLLAGVLIFSGSLYTLAIFDLGFMGAVAPIGGALMLAGWASLAYGVWRDGEHVL